MTSLYQSAEGKRDIMALYHQKLEDLNINYEDIEVETSFGTTHLIATGNPAHPPAIVVHGSNGCAPVALETYPNLSQSFRVYAVDVIAQPNKSAETRPSMKDASYGQWMNEVMAALNLDEVTLAGFSFGGLVILKTLEFDESRVKEVFLSSPAYVVNGNPFKALFKVFLPMKRYMRTQHPKHVEQFLAEVFTDRDEFAIRYLSKVFLEFKMDFTRVPVIRRKQAATIQTPITIFAAEQDLLFPGKKLLNRAQRIFPSLKAGHLILDSKHVQNRIQNSMIEEAILR